MSARTQRVRARAGGLMVLGLALAVGGCATINYDTGTIQSVVAMNRVAQTAAYERVSSFEEQTRAVFVIADLITVVDSKMADIIQRELARTGGDAVINLRIHEEYDIIDAAIAVAQSALLFGARVVGTRTITYNGDIVRWTGDTDDLEEELSALAGVCAPLEIPQENGSRTAYVCGQ